MSVEDTDIVDVMGTERGTGDVILTISDHLPWTASHWDILEKKLAEYVRFFENGQLSQVNPAAAGSRVVISVIAKYRPTAAAVEFLQQAEVALAKRRLLFRYGPLPPEGYVDDAV